MTKWLLKTTPEFPNHLMGPDVIFMTHRSNVTSSIRLPIVLMEHQCAISVTKNATECERQLIQSEFRE